MVVRGREVLANGRGWRRYGGHPLDAFEGGDSLEGWRQALFRIMMMVVVVMATHVSECRSRGGNHVLMMMMRMRFGLFGAPPNGCQSPSALFICPHVFLLGLPTFTAVGAFGR